MKINYTIKKRESSFIVGEEVIFIGKNRDYKHHELLKAGEPYIVDKVERPFVMLRGIDAVWFSETYFIKLEGADLVEIKVRSMWMNL